MIIPVNANPANKVVKKINEQTKDNILLVGKKGYGKTKVLDTLEMQENNKIILDGTISSLNYSFIYDNDIHNLYIICNTIKQILLSIHNNYKDKYNHDFLLLEKIVSNIISKIDNMKVVQEYSKLDINPNILLDTLMSNLVKSFNTSDITLVIDDFDKVNYSSVRYQKLIYYTLRKYLKLILTVSDSEVYDNIDKLNDLSKENDIVLLNYSLNVYDVYNILLEEFNIEGMLSYETLSKIIAVSDGNLNIIFNFINYLKQNIHKVKDNNYDSFLLSYLEEYSFNIKSVYHTMGRKLHI